MPNGAGCLDSQEAVEYLGCTPNWLRERVKFHQIAYSRIGKKLWFDPVDLDAAVLSMHRSEAVGMVPAGRGAPRRRVASR